VSEYPTPHDLTQRTIEGGTRAKAGHRYRPCLTRKVAVFRSRNASRGELPVPGRSVERDSAYVRAMSSSHDKVYVEGRAERLNCKEDRTRRREGGFSSDGSWLCSPRWSSLAQVLSVPFDYLDWYTTIW